MNIRPDVIAPPPHAQAEPPFFGELSRDEIIALLHLVMTPQDEDRQTYYLGLLGKHLPNAGISDLIFYSDRDRSVEEIADEALHRVTLWRNDGLGALRAHLVHLADQVRADPHAPIWAMQWAHGYRD